MKRDIENRADIEILVNHFYEKIKTDPIIGYIFTDIAHVNWEKHLPLMYDFWENAIFYTGKTKHFEQWNKLFISSVNELFEGDNANLIKQRAISISTVMQIKILNDYAPVSKVY